MTTSRKKLINTVSRCVEDCLQGLVAINPGLQILEGHPVVLRQDIDDVRSQGQVTLISGGGSGHEPAHAGYVGPGMLSAAVAGAVFTSPPPASILAAIRTVGCGNPAGTLIIVKNYTGDRLNFGLAAERAKAEGLKVELVGVGEDCALTLADKTAGRRGLCGTVFIHKIAGALAEEGKSLEEISDICRRAAGAMGTIGVSLSPCSLPGAGPSFTLAPDTMELGLGIHGEAGVKTLKVLTAMEAVAAMFEHMTSETSCTRLKLDSGDQVALMVNNLGGTSVLELNIVAREAINWLESRGVLVTRAYVGSFVTSLEMAGVSLTVLHLDETRTRCLDAATTAPAWCRPLLVRGQTTRLTPSPRTCVADVRHDTSASSAAKVDQEVAAMLHRCVTSSFEALAASEQLLNALDTESGDGDCGTTLKRGADAVLAAIGSTDKPGLPTSCPHRLLLALAALLEKNMGGSSGALYSLFLTAAAGPVAMDTSGYGGAERGDRTMLDALCPALYALKADLHVTDPLIAFRNSVQAAEIGARDTSKMAARAGRASYVSADRLTQADPGAHAVWMWMDAALRAWEGGP